MRRSAGNYAEPGDLPETERFPLFNLNLGIQLSHEISLQVGPDFGELANQRGIDR